MTLYISNAFSLNMLEIPKQIGKWYHLYVKELSIEEARREVKKALEEGMKVESVVGHESTANLLSQLLGINIKAERKAITVRGGDALLVAQLVFRPPEGKVYNFSELIDLFNEGKIKLILVEIHEKFVP